MERFSRASFRNGRKGARCIGAWRSTMGEDPILVYMCEDGTKKTYFASDWVMNQMDAQNGRIERGTRLTWGALVLSVLSLVLLAVSIALR